MKTYQDLLDTPEGKKADFVRTVINDHKASGLYQTAVLADEYDRHMNRTILQYQQLLYTLSGASVPDNYSANWKMPSKFFHRFVLQEVQYLLGNGVTWEQETTAQRLGADFDTRLQEIAKDALVGGVAFGFYNLDHMDTFHVREFAPLYDEENGALMAGVRWWQITPIKPLRATLYEPDGYTDYIWRDGKAAVLHPKRPYILHTVTSVADGTVIFDGENYPTFPIVPLYANQHKQSELIGLREQIDCYDLIKSGFANDLDDASQIYWTIQNAGGMDDDITLAQFVERMKTVKAAVVDDNVKVESHALEVPYAGREALLDRISKDLYKDAMAFDNSSIVSGATTATQIRAAYEPLNSKCDDFEFCVLDFLRGILLLAGIEGEKPTFTRSQIVNKNEEVQTLLQAAEYLEPDYLTEKVLTIFGDGDKAKDILDKRAENEIGTPEEEQAEEEMPENGTETEL